MTVYKPPMRVPSTIGRSVFLAGSIEMGRAADWQAQLVIDLARDDIAFLNPRRDAWDATWRQSIDEPQFREQVEWELDGLDRADVIAMWFAPETQAPITLLELGLHARGGRLVVGCPDGFWRKGNIEILCARYAIPLANDWQSFVGAVRARLAG